MKVSVAMAYYNGGEYINEQLSSILSQLGEEDEVILSVDAADDGSEKLLKKRAEEDARIPLLRGPGKGVVKNFARAIAHCSGDVIFLSDQDDIWWDDKVKTVLRAFQEKGTAAVVHNAEIIDAHGEKAAGTGSVCDARKPRRSLEEFLKKQLCGLLYGFSPGTAARHSSHTGAHVHA